MAVPLYQSIAQALLEKIESGELSKGSQLPTEIELRETFNASQNTVRDAVKWLTSRGLVEQVPGRGACVVGRAVSRPPAGSYIGLDDTSYALFRRIGDDLRNRIESGVLPAGIPLYNDVLREHYGASRKVIRDAISWLAFYGFVAAHPGRKPVVLGSSSSGGDTNSEDSLQVIGNIALETVFSRLDFGCALCVVIRDAGLTVEQAGARGKSLGSVSLTDYLAGRNLPETPQILRDFLMVCDIDDEEQVNQWLRTLKRVRELSPSKSTERPASRQDEELNFLFRIYVSKARLYSAEAHRLLSLFQDWLAGVRGLGIRYGGYETPSGRVYEFFVDPSLKQSVLSGEFGNFSNFLTLCYSDPATAAEILREAGVDPTLSSDLIARFGDEARRLEIDARHERERRILAIRHRLEGELLDKGPYLNEVSGDNISNLLDSLIPNPSALVPMALLGGPDYSRASHVTLNINNPQFVHAISSTVAHNVEGSIHFGPEARDILALIERFGGQQSTVLKSALHEVEDTAVQRVDRAAAKDVLKKFLKQLSGIAQDVAIKGLETYIDHKVGFK